MYMRGLFIERSHRAGRYIGFDGISWSIVNVHLLIACPRAIPSIRDCVGLLGIRDKSSCRWVWETIAAPYNESEINTGIAGCWGISGVKALE